MRSFTLMSLFTLTCLAQPPGNGNLGPLQPPDAPQGNAPTTAKVYLGKALFYDEQLSSTGTVACGTCHRPASGGADPRVLTTAAVNPGNDAVSGTSDDVVGSPGVPLHFEDGSYVWSTDFALESQVTGRKTPSAIDAAYSPPLFWDGRAGQRFSDPITGEVILPDDAALESQVLGPPVSTAEMGHIDRDWQQVAERIAASPPLGLAASVPAALANWIGERTYPDLFDEVFGDSSVTPARIAMAIASYERVLYSDQTPHDGTFDGSETLTPLERQGRNEFIRNDCARCHGGPLLSDNQFHYIGVRPRNEDLGRFEETGNNGDRGRFKTPSLRNVALRAPYMHNGAFETLAEVVDFYDRGGDFDAPNKDNRIRPLNLSQQEKNALIAFMTRPLTDPRVAAELPPFDRPTLYSETDRVPVVEASDSSHRVMAHAIEPPLAGTDEMTVAVSGGLEGAEAVLVIDESVPGTGAIPGSGSLARKTITLQGLTQDDAYGSVEISIPETVAGRTYHGRWYVIDANAPNGFSVSPSFSFTVFTSAAETWCAGDIDRDGAASILDLIAIIEEEGRDCPVPCGGDVSADGLVDDGDTMRVIETWRTCR